MHNFNLSQEQIAEFKSQGMLVIPGFYNADTDLLPIQRGIYDVIGQVMLRNSFPDARIAFDAKNFDVGYQDLIKKNRAWGGEVYDAVKQIPAFFRLVSHPAHEQIIRQLRPGSIPGVAAGGYGIRIDNPNEDKFRAMWHQEYPAQLRSLDGIVFWSPLVPVTEILGPVQFCPTSHLGGALPVKWSDPEGVGRTGAYALMLNKEESILARYTKIAPLTSLGDLVLIDFLTLHASGHNRGTRARWTMQFRYFNFAEPTGSSHGWKGSFAAGVDFRKIHPELCVD